MSVQPPRLEENRTNAAFWSLSNLMSRVPFMGMRFCYGTCAGVALQFAGQGRLFIVLRFHSILRFVATMAEPIAR